jgi:hypothetical protein
VCNDGSGSRLGSDDTSTYPGSGPSTPEVKPLLPALVFILSTWWLTVLLELCCLEEKEEGFDLPTLRVQAPLYRRGPGYSTSSVCPATGFPVDAVLAWVPLFYALCLGACRFIKHLFPLDRYIRGVYALGLPWILSWMRGLLDVVGGGRVWLASCWSPASIDLIGTLIPLIKSRLKVLVIFAGSGL